MSFLAAAAAASVALESKFCSTFVFFVRVRRLYLTVQGEQVIGKNADKLRGLGLTVDFIQSRKEPNRLSPARPCKSRTAGVDFEALFCAVPSRSMYMYNSAFQKSGFIQIHYNEITLRVLSD